VKPLKWVGIVVVFYVAFVVAFEAGYLGAYQPSFEDAGIPMLILTTTDESGESRDRMLARFETDGKLYVSAHHWPRGWYKRALRSPEVRVEIDGMVSDYVAVPVEGEEFRRVAAEYPLPFLVRFLMGFPPERDILRLDQLRSAAGSESVSSREVVHSRRIAADPGRVFDAISDPRRLARWWGPNGFSSTFHTFEFRRGGKWTLTLHGPDGTDYPNENVFVEIVPQRLVIIEHVAEDHHFVLTITLEPEGNGTLVRWEQVFDTAAHKDDVATIVLGANEQNLDRLEAEAIRPAETA